MLAMQSWMQKDAKAAVAVAAFLKEEALESVPSVIHAVGSSE